MLSSVEQAFVGREEIRAPLKTPAWEANPAAHPHKPLIRRYPSPGWSVTRDFVGPFRSHLRRSQSGPGLVASLHLSLSIQLIIEVIDFNYRR